MVFDAFCVYYRIVARYHDLLSQLALVAERFVVRCDPTALFGRPLDRRCRFEILVSEFESTFERNLCVLPIVKNLQLPFI